MNRIIQTLPYSPKKNIIQTPHQTVSRCPITYKKPFPKKKKKVYTKTHWTLNPQIRQYFSLIILIFFIYFKYVLE